MLVTGEGASLERALGGSERPQEGRAGGKSWNCLVSMLRGGPDLRNGPWALAPCRQEAEKAGGGSSW